MSLKLVIDKHGPMGIDCECLDRCHFEDPENPEQNPASPKLSDAIDFVLSSKSNCWGYIMVSESYDSVADALGERLALFEYRYGELLNSHACFKKVGDCFMRTNLEELLEKEVQLISVYSGAPKFNYHLVLASTSS